MGGIGWAETIYAGPSALVGMIAVGNHFIGGDYNWLFSVFYVLLISVFFVFPSSL